VPNFRQANRVDGEAKDFLFVQRQPARKMTAFEVFWNERVVAGFEAVLHGQIQGGGRFSAAAHPHQNDIAFVEVLIGLTVVVGEAEIDRLYAVVVFLAFAGI
jgi:hypothetical protein